MEKHFIQADSTPCTFDRHVNAPYFRKSFELDFVPERAEIRICGLGFYRLFVNGREITKGFLAPYISNPDQVCYYDAYDVLPYLQMGKNTLGVLLGNGMMNPFGGVVWEFDRADCLGAPRLALEATVEARGKELRFHGDDSFRTHPSPIIFDELRMGEHYDARLEIPGWNLPEFDDSTWQAAIPAEKPRGQMRLCGAEAVRVQKEWGPVSIEPCGDGYLYDFGENTAGLTRLTISADAGQRITLRHCEMLLDGNFYNGNIIFDRPNTKFYKDYHQKTVYIAAGNGEETYLPSFTYYGFRYVLVQGITPEQAKESLVQAVMLHSDLPKIGDFSCSDETMNALFQMAVRSDVTNFYYFPTDCPHREKNGWTGDASLSAEHMVRLYDTQRSWREWLRNIRLSQNEAGALPGIVPTFGWGFEWGNGPAWDSVLFNLPYCLYRYRGDMDVIRENAAAMLRYLHYVQTRKAADGTIAIGLGDWCPVGKEPDQSAAPVVLTDSIMVMDMAKKASEMFHAVGMHREAAFADGIFLDTREAIRGKLIDPQTMTAAGRCQTSQAMCLSYGVFQEAEEPQAMEVLLELIHENQDSFDCGYLGMHALFFVLSEHGQGELARQMIMKREYPSYGNLLERGYTTLPEGFFPDTELLRSGNHHFFGDISRWFICHVAGLQVVDSRHVRVAPGFLSGLNHAQASYRLPGGWVTVSWKKRAEGYVLSLKKPAGVSAELDLGQDKDRVTVVWQNGAP